MVGIRLAAFQLVEGNIIARIEFVITMQLMIHTLTKRLEELFAGQVFQLAKPCIDGGSTMVMNTAFIAKNTRLHIVKVILTWLLKGWIIALLLELLSLQIVARVEFIADGKRDDVQFIQWSAHSQHLEHGVLGTVVAVLGTSLTLGNPNILTLLGNSIVDVAAHELTGTHHFMGRQATTNGKGLVHPDQTLNPRINQ